MFSSVTATGVVGVAGDWASEIQTVVLIVLGFGMAIAIANYVIAKFRRSRASGGRKRRRR